MGEGDDIREHQHTTGFEATFGLIDLDWREESDGGRTSSKQIEKRNKKRCYNKVGLFYQTF